MAYGTNVIDPEFGFLGQPEFDLGVMLAHLKLAQQETAVQQQVLNQYQAPADFKPALLRAFIGTEILRRLIGLAQLPLSLGFNAEAGPAGRSRPDDFECLANGCKPLTSLSAIRSRSLQNRAGFVGICGPPLGIFIVVGNFQKRFLLAIGRCPHRGVVRFELIRTGMSW